MDGLARISGTLFRNVTVGGKEYRLACPRLRDFAELEAQILAHLPDPLEAAFENAAKVPSNQVEAYWKAVYQAAANRSFGIANLSQLPFKMQIAANAFIVLQRYHSDEIRTLNDAVDWVEKAEEEYDVPVLMGMFERLMKGAEQPSLKNG
jgi:hypothetical protein